MTPGPEHQAAWAIKSKTVPLLRPDGPIYGKITGLIQPGKGKRYSQNGRHEAERAEDNDETPDKGLIQPISGAQLFRHHKLLERFGTEKTVPRR